jgi:hypothetical protein
MRASVASLPGARGRTEVRQMSERGASRPCGGALRSQDGGGGRRASAHGTMTLGFSGSPLEEKRAAPPVANVASDNGQESLTATRSESVLRNVAQPS